MLKRVRIFFSPPTFLDAIKSQRAHDLNSIIIYLFIALLIWVWYLIISQMWIQLIAFFSAFLLLTGLYFLLKKGYVTLVGRFLTLLLWLSVIVTVTISGGIRSPGFVALGIVIAIASIVMGTRVGFLYVAITILAGIILLIAENLGLLPEYISESNITTFFIYELTILLIGLFISLTNRNIQKYKENSVTAESNTNLANSSLVKYRQDLEKISQIIEQREGKIKVFAEMAQLATKEKTEDGLLDSVINLIVNKMNIDHVGIFLVDNMKENMVLLKTNSLEGRNLLTKNYSLRITNNPLVASTNESEVIKIRYKESTLFVTQPVTLAESKSNISVALATNEKLFGLLNLQSYSPDPWLVDEESVQTLANQIALALDNFRLLEELSIRTHEISLLAGDVTQTAWKEIARGKTIGYQYDHLHILPKHETLPSEVHNALDAQKTAHYRVEGDNPSARLVAPIVLRGQVIGVIGYEDINPSHEWSATEITILETIASRVSLAVENSRLVAEAEQRAENEQIIGQISSHIRETLDFETILQTALQELHSKFELHEAEIRLQTKSLES